MLNITYNRLKVPFSGMLYFLRYAAFLLKYEKYIYLAYIRQSFRRPTISSETIRYG